MFLVKVFFGGGQEEHIQWCSGYCFVSIFKDHTFEARVHLRCQGSDQVGHLHKFYLFFYLWHCWFLHLKAVKGTHFCLFILLNVVSTKRSPDHQISVSTESPIVLGHRKCIRALGIVDDMHFTPSLISLNFTHKLVYN